MENVERDVAAFPLRIRQCWMLVSRVPFPLTLPGITVPLTVKVDSGGKWDWRGGGRWIDLEEIRTPVIFVRIKGSLLSLFLHVCACIHPSRAHTRSNVYVHSPDIRGETCYCVMISERFVASRCNPAGISTIDVCSTL